MACSYLEIVILAQIEQLPVVRKAFVEQLKLARVCHEDIEEVELAVGEAVSNAIKYGCKAPDELVHIEFCLRKNLLVIGVIDHGQGFNPRKELNKQKKLSLERLDKRGITILYGVMDTVYCDRYPAYSPYGSRLVMSKRLTLEEEKNES